MKKQILLFVMLVSLANLSAQIKQCNNENQKNYSCGNVQENILERIANKGFVMETRFNVNLASIFDKEKDQKRAVEIVTLCNQVLNDSDFWNALQNYDTYKYAVFEQNEIKRELTGIQIVNCLINGNPDNSSRPSLINISLDIELYGLSFKTFFEKAVAKEIGDGKIYNKRWFFRGSKIESIGSNWIHEYSHMKGLTHCYYCDENRDYSVPYVINRIFEEVAKKYIN